MLFRLPVTALTIDFSGQVWGYLMCSSSITVKQEVAIRRKVPTVTQNLIEEIGVTYWSALHEGDQQQPE